MRSEQILAFFFLICIILHLNSCYSTQIVPSKNLHLEERDKIISYIEKNDSVTRIQIDYWYHRFIGAYICEDTLYIKINSPQGRKQNIIEHIVPLSDVKSLE